MELLYTVIIMVIIVIMIIIIIIIKKKEHIVNLNESHKTDLKKCCQAGKCISEPSFLKEDCKEIKINSLKILKKEYDQMFSKEMYNKLLNKLNIRRTNYSIEGASNTSEKIDRIEKEKELQKRQQITLNNMDVKTYNMILNDSIDTISGYSKN